MPFILCPHHLSQLHHRTLKPKTPNISLFSGSPPEESSVCDETSRGTWSPSPATILGPKHHQIMGIFQKECHRVCTHLSGGGGGGWGGVVVDRDFPNLSSGGYCLCRGILLAIT